MGCHIFGYYNGTGIVRNAPLFMLVGQINSLPTKITSNLSNTGVKRTIKVFILNVSIHQHLGGTAHAQIPLYFH